jgi:hypothetical protein
MKRKRAEVKTLYAKKERNDRKQEIKYSDWRTNEQTRAQNEREGKGVRARETFYLHS